MIRSYVGDLLADDAGIIAHQVNCCGVMGAGVAKQIRVKKLTENQYKGYVRVCRENGARLLGCVLFQEVDGEQTAAHVFGENIPTGKTIDTDYDALKRGMISVRDYAEKYSLSVAVPGLMGCGLAGGDWNIVLHEILEPLFSGDGPELRIVYFRKEDFLKYACVPC